MRGRRKRKRWMKKGVYFDLLGFRSTFAGICTEVHVYRQTKIFW